MEERTDNIRMARRTYSRVGLGLAVMFLVEIVLSLGLGLLFDLDQVDGSSVRWTVFGQIIPVYGSMLAGYLVLRRLLANPPELHTLRPGQFLRLAPITSFTEYAANGVGGLLLLLIGLLLRLIFGDAPETPDNPVVSLVRQTPPVLDFLLTVVAGPIVEELFCRKAIIDRTRIFGERLAVVFSAVVFGIFHHSFAQFLYTVALGLLFGYVYIRTGRLRYTVALHIYNNLLGFLAAKLSLSAGLLDAVEGAGALPQEKLLPMTGFVLLMAALFITGLVLFIRNIKTVHFEPAEREVPAGKWYRAPWCSVSMIVYAALGLFLAVTG